MLYVDRAIGLLWRRLALIVAVKSGHVEHYVQMFNMTTPRCSDRG